MKFKSKLKVALDMCINDKWKFRAALITTVAFLCIVMQIIYMTSTSGIYKSRVNMALSKDIEGLLYVEFKSDDVNGMFWAFSTDNDMVYRQGKRNDNH